MTEGREIEKKLYALGIPKGLIADLANVTQPELSRFFAENWDKYSRRRDRILAAVADVEFLLSLPGIRPEMTAVNVRAALARHRGQENGRRVIQEMFTTATA